MKNLVSSFCSKMVVRFTFVCPSIGYDETRARIEVVLVCAFVGAAQCSPVQTSADSLRCHHNRTSNATNLRMAVSGEKERGVG